METADNATVVPPRRRGSFVPGDPRANVSGRPKKKVHEYVPPADDGAPVALMDMRHVHLNQKQHDRTAGQELMREFHKKDPKGFLAQMAALEKEHRLSLKEGGRSGGEGGSPRDLGTEACVALAEKLIGELAVKGGG